MKRFILAVALLLSCALSSNAGKIVTDTLRSAILGTDVVFNAYLPNGFGADPSARYPVVYLLHGLSDDYTAWRDRGNMQTVADELIEAGEAVPMVIIMPNAGGPDIHNMWNGYFNMPGWRYEDFFFGEFLPGVERKYCCGGDKGMRAIMGLSMGGGGSTVYCQRHPELFSSCYAMSAWLDNKDDEVGGKQSAEDKFYLVCKAVREHSALDFLDNADDQTKEKLRSVKWFFDCGDDDYLLSLTLSIHMKMRQERIKDELRVRNGVHNWEYWHLALRMALPFASRNFGSSPAGSQLL